MFDFSRVSWVKVQSKTIETLVMTFESLAAVVIIGICLGLLLYLSSNSNGAFGRIFYAVVSAIVNIFRAIPFIILIVLLLPFTKTLVGSISGPQAAMPALILSAAPFYARLVEIGLREVDKGVIEAGGLGNLAYLDGFQRNNNTLTFVATVLILVIVFAIQILGDFVVKRIDKR